MTKGLLPFDPRFGCTESLQEKASLRPCGTAPAAVKRPTPEPEELDDVPPFDGGTETAVELLVRNQAVDNRISVGMSRTHPGEFSLAARRLRRPSPRPACSRTTA